MEIDDPKLHIGQGQEAYLQGGADRLTSVRSVQLPKDVVKVCLDRRCGQTKVRGQPFCGVSLGNASENLHLPGCERNHVALR